MKKRKKMNNIISVSENKNFNLAGMMKIKILKYSIGLLFLGYFAGCDDYENKEIAKNIYVDQSSLSLFVGETIQLTASPTDGTYQYQWSSEDSEVATVTSGGLVEAIKEGSTNIIVKSGDVVTKVPLTAVVRIPLEDVAMSETFLELLPGKEKSILVTYIPENANDVPAYSWSSENPDVATVSKGGKITVIGEGVTDIVYRIGDIVKKIKVDVAYTRVFKGPHVLSAAAPYELSSANFDLGGEGYAFHDADTDNRTNNDYRKNNGDSQSAAVDIEGDGVNIGYTNSGEWLLYTVEVEDAGNYLVEALVAGPDRGSFHLEVDGINVTGAIDFSATGGWGSYRWISSPENKLTIDLTEGRHKIKFYFEGGFNFKALKFTKK
ncbi:MAG TPA: beta-glucanase/beta-glucan synthetase [Porphyromonadaceae bacterium]|nr:beta-glucanase/beta-glucan synthetase [Porphyromonadaceae bacterium]